MQRWDCVFAVPRALTPLIICYNSRRMFTLLFFVPAAILFMAINIVLGCYLAVRLGYGPPNWQTALNQVVRLTTLQDCLNAGRDWLEHKVPKADQFLTRLQIPKPVIIIDTTYVEEEEEEDEIMAVEGVRDEEDEEGTADGEQQTTEEPDAEQPLQEPGTEQNAVPE